MHHLSSLLFLWLIGILYCGLAETGPTDKLSKANNAFAVDLYKKIGEVNSGNNLFFSPISISTAFGMVNLGARGKTREQTKAVLHLDEMSSDEAVKEGYKQLLMSLSSKDNNYTLHLVNRLFGSNSFDFHQKFLRETQDYFGASLENLDFEGHTEKSRGHINEWVEEETKKNIKDILPPGSIDGSTILLIVNAIYFKAMWTFPFQQRLTKPGPFSISKSQTEDMAMMHLYREFLNYYNSYQLKCEVLELPYKGNKVSMFVFLPHDVEGLPDLETRLTGKVLAETLNKVRRSPMTVQLPKFTIDQVISLKEFLQMLGMVDVFEEQKADLAGIGRPGRLVISDAMHKAFVNVDETGTVAAAATATRSKTSLPPRPVLFIANRPFLFLIYEKDSSNVLFMGRLVRPPASKENVGKFREMTVLHSSAASRVATYSAFCSVVIMVSALWCLSQTQTLSGSALLHINLWATKLLVTVATKGDEACNDTLDFVSGFKNHIE